MRIKRGLQLGAMCIALSLATSARAITIGFDDLAADTSVTDEYAPQGVTFGGGVVVATGSDAFALRVRDVRAPAITMTFAAPIRHFFTAVYEFDLPPEVEDWAPIEVPPADDAKPDSRIGGHSVYPTLHCADGSTQALDVVHALLA